MSETPTQELIDDLRSSVRWWKAIALTLLAGLCLVIVLGIGAATVATVQAQRARQQAEAARDAEMEARMAVERFLQRDLLQGPVDQPAGK
jgi:uncharacterized protein HemX